MSLQHRRIALVGAGLAAVVITLLSAVPSATAIPDPRTTDPIQAAAGWLASQFVDKSHLPAPDGDHFRDSHFPNYGANADVIFGLAAAKSGQHKINAALAYLVHHLHGYTDLSNSDGFGPYDGSIGKLAVAAIVAGADPTDIKGHDLIAALAADECPSDSITCAPGSPANIFSSISESFVILAEVRAGGTGPTADAVSYFLSLQCANGGFTNGTAACGSGHSEVDATSYAIMALTALGDHPAKLHHAVVWLRDHQRAKGYWVNQDVPNTNSTGLAAAALDGAGRPLSGARHWLRSQQIGAGKPGAGAFRYAGDFTPTTKSATSSSVLATAQALTGLGDEGSLATLTAAGTVPGTKMYPARIKAPRRVPLGSQVKISGIGFAAGEYVHCELGGRLDPRIIFPDTVVNPAGVLALRMHAGRAVMGSHEIRCGGLSSNLYAYRRINVVAPN